MKHLSPYQNRILAIAMPLTGVGRNINHQIASLSQSSAYGMLSALILFSVILVFPLICSSKRYRASGLISILSTMLPIPRPPLLRFSSALVVSTDLALSVITSSISFSVARLFTIFVIWASRISFATSGRIKSKTTILSPMCIQLSRCFVLLP